MTSTEAESKAVDLPVELRSHPHLRLQALGSDERMRSQIRGKLAFS